MGVGADSIDNTGLWQFQAMYEGYRKAHQSEDEAKAELSMSEVDELSALIKAPLS